MPITRPEPQSRALFALLPQAPLTPGDSIQVAPDDACVLVVNGQIGAQLGPGAHPMPGHLGPSADVVFVKQAPVMGHPYGGPVTGMVDPATGATLDARVSGECILQATDAQLLARSAASSASSGPDAFSKYAEGALLSAAGSALGKALAENKTTVANLALGAMGALPEIARLASDTLAPVGVRVLAVSSCQVQLADGRGGYAAPQAAQMPPTPQQAADAAMKRMIDQHNPLNKEYTLKVKSGALAVDISKDGIKLDEDRLKKKVGDKIKDKLWGIVFTIALLGVMLLIVGGVGLYVAWHWNDAPAKAKTVTTPVKH